MSNDQIHDNIELMKTNCGQHTLESKQQLKIGGLKITSARLGLLDMFKHAKTPLAVKDIAKKFTGKTDLVTLYRNVESLENLGLIKKLSLNDRQAYYELANDHHHHLICENCHRIVDIKDCDVPGVEKNIKTYSGFATISRHSLEFFGLCKNCAKKIK